MPITTGALRKQRADRRKTVLNRGTKSGYRELVTAMRKKPTQATLTKLFSQIDRAAKKRVIHVNKAARLKSRMAKLLAK